MSEEGKEVARPIPMCWKCRDSQWGESNESVGTVVAKELVGCDADERINNYIDAEEYCPLMKLIPTE
jgi:hypothetical protein